VPEPYDLRPGEPAPVAGSYRMFNVFGLATRLTVTVAQGAPLPPAPHGYSWWLVTEEALVKS
jgi:hypothetical protein